MEEVSVLFVCLGNICRSPTAEGVFRKQVADAGLDDRIQIDSSGTGDWHIGHPPDSRAASAALARGYDLSAIRARLVCAEDFERFDHVLAMDDNNLEDMKSMCPGHHQHKLKLFLDFAEGGIHRNVPDPYYGGADGFDQVIDLVESASTGLLNHLQTQLN